MRKGSACKGEKMNERQRGKIPRQSEERKTVKRWKMITLKRKSQKFRKNQESRKWRRKWQPTPVFLPGESQGWGSLVGCCLWGHTGSDTTEVTQQQQQESRDRKTGRKWEIKYNREKRKIELVSEEMKEKKVCMWGAGMKFSGNVIGQGSNVRAIHSL